MNIQNILWPQVGICTETAMYYRCNVKVQILESNSLIFMKNGIATFDTYFNGLSIDKWRKYTIVKDIYLNLHLQGAFIISLVYKYKVNNEIIQKTILKEHFFSKDPKEIIINIPSDIRGMVYFELEALAPNSILYGGFYGSNIPENNIKYVKIGIDICTFKRETFIEKNIAILKKYLLENTTSQLYGHLEVFISDNGKTLDIPRLSTEQIHIIKNKNTGGAGGFTRGLIEILNANENSSNITHVLLMDDDILIEPESLIKTYNILSLLKSEYSEAFIGGAMLRNDKQNIQVESGAAWYAGSLESLKVGLNMNESEACIYNEVEEYREFNAWWYCCIPVSIVTYSNLPLPLFIRGDDVEYGLRNMKHLILINGICVWHEPFENKYSSFLSYYILRNQLIDNTIHCPQYGKKQLKRQLLAMVVRELMYYRYKNIDLILAGVEDFLKGSMWLLETDGEALHKEVMSKGYKNQILESLNIPFSYPVYDKSFIENDSGIKRIFRLATLNGYLLKANRNNIVSMAKIRAYNAYRAKRILNYDVTTNKGFITEKSFKDFIRCISSFIITIHHINKKYNIAKSSYLNKKKDIQNIKFWKKYLQIGDKINEY